MVTAIKAPRIRLTIRAFRNFVGHFAGLSPSRHPVQLGWSEADLRVFCDIHLDELSTQ